MLAFATPVTHTQSVEPAHSSSSTATRARAATRPQSLSSLSAPVVPTAASTSFVPRPPSSKRPPASSANSDHVVVPDRHVPLSNQPSTSMHVPKAEKNMSSEAVAHSDAALVALHEQDSTNLLKCLASLLQQIATSNDKLRSPDADSASSPSLNSPSKSPVFSHPPIWSSLTAASRTSLSSTSAAFSFHARNIPTISLDAYLLRILKYCPTTNEVFLSLLVYFDRMSKLCHEATGRTFVIDSYNVHRLVIAGVTVASKFFSDVFYTNSRYAKVGGLPQHELNQLELQFLLLNDFRLSITTEELQRYAEQLQIYSKTPPSDATSPPPSSHLQHDLITSSMRRMGATDAYGGRLPGAPMTESERILATYGGVLGGVDVEPSQQATKHLRDPSTESYPESYPETEDEGTDDEPTIRAYSSTESETQSLCTVESNEEAYSECGFDNEEPGEVRTPETGAAMSPSDVD